MPTPNGDCRSWRASLAVVARNERRFLGFADSDLGFDPEIYKGKVVVTTMHRAKGLEWDKVYLMSVNDYNFPSALPQDQFISESWFIRDRLNLEAEAVAQLKALEANPDLFDYGEGTPTLEARLDYASERLRLFFVAITRARKRAQRDLEHRATRQCTAVRAVHRDAELVGGRMSLLPDDFSFSQASLQDFEVCRRRFYLRYVLGLRWPASPAEPIDEHERRVRWGPSSIGWRSSIFLACP